MFLLPAFTCLEHECQDLLSRVMECMCAQIRARMHHKVVGNFGSEADIRSLYFRGFRFNETSDNGACTHGQPVT